MRLMIAFLIIYLTIHNVDPKGLTMITRGCISKYLKQNQLLSVSLKIGPVPNSAVCNDIVKNVKQAVIDSAVNSQMKFSEESDTDDVTAYKMCFRKLVDKNIVSDVLLKNFMYHEEEVENHQQMEMIANAILNLFGYLCRPNELNDDLNQKFPNSFAGYEKEVNRYCLVNLLREQEVVDQDFNVNFELSDTSNVKCPAYINQDILNVKTEGFDLIHQNDLYRNEVIWECAAEERMKIGYTRAYYRLMAYTFSHENETRKSEERQKFLSVLHSANEIATKCFTAGYENL